jgi:hypothetical protein
MAIQQNTRPAPFAFIDSLPAPRAPSPYKLDRLRELRATIDCLRSEREGRDPLLAWIVEREKADFS